MRGRWSTSAFYWKMNQETTRPLKWKNSSNVPWRKVSLGRKWNSSKNTQHNTQSWQKNRMMVLFYPFYPTPSKPYHHATWRCSLHRAAKPLSAVPSSAPMQSMAFYDSGRHIKWPTLGAGRNILCASCFSFLTDGLVGMAIVGGIGLGVAGLAGLIGLAVSKGGARSWDG